MVLLTPTPDLKENILDEQAALVGHVEMIHQLGKEFSIPVVDVYAHLKALAMSGADIPSFMSQRDHTDPF